MEKPKKLSLQQEMEREARQIEKEILENPELDDIQVTEEMDLALLERIRAYEEEKKEEEAAKREIAKKRKDANVEFSEELAPDLSVLAKYGKDGRNAANEHVNDEPAVADIESKASTTAIPHRRKRRKYLFVSLAAVLILVLGLGMTSVGSKSYWKVLWEKFAGKEPVKVINVEDMDSQGTEDGDEISVYREIGEQLGITAVRIRYKPKEMILTSSQIDEEVPMARLFYKYGNEVIRYTMYLNDTDSSWGEEEEDKKIDEYTITVNEQEIKVEEFQVSGYEEYRRSAVFEYRGVHYQLKGIMEKEEFEKILKDLYFS